MNSAATSSSSEPSATSSSRLLSPGSGTSSSGALAPQAPSATNSSQIVPASPGTSAPSTPGVVKSTPPGTPRRGMALTPAKSPVISSPLSSNKPLNVVLGQRQLRNVSITHKKVNVEGPVVGIWFSRYQQKGGGETIWGTVQLAKQDEYFVVKFQGNVDGINVGDIVRIANVSLSSVAAQAQRGRNNDPNDNPFPPLYLTKVDVTGTKYANGMPPVQKLADGNGVAPDVTASVANIAAKGAVITVEGVIVEVEEQQPDETYAQCRLTCEDPTSKEQYKVLLPCAWAETARTMEVGGHLTLVNAYVRSRNDQHQNIISVRIGVPNRLDSAVYYEPPSDVSENAAKAPAVKKMKTDPALSDGGAWDDDGIF